MAAEKKAVEKTNAEVLHAAERDGVLSKRGLKLARSEMPEYIAKTIGAEAEAEAKKGDAGLVPVVNLSVAENREVFPLLREKLAASRDLAQASSYYGAPEGDEPLRAAVAAFLRRRVFRCKGKVDPGNVIVTNGVGPLLQSLTMALCDVGDAVLLPTPTYAGFEMEMVPRTGAKLLQVPGDEGNGYRLTTSMLDRAVEECERGGLRPRVLVFANPNNPTGILHSPEEVRDVLQWCKKRQIHVLADEIYAMSTHTHPPPSGGLLAACAGRDEDGGANDPCESFHSVVKVMEMYPDCADADRVHVQYGMSKDFGLSGFRVGFLYTCSRAVRMAVSGQAIFTWVSRDTQHVVARLLADDEFVDDYLIQMQRSLRVRHKLAAKSAEAFGFKVIPAQGGFFIWIGGIPHVSSFKDEKRLWNRLLERARVILTPGEACGCPDPGYFRLCFAAATESQLHEALRRMGKEIELWKENNRLCA